MSDVLLVDDDAELLHSLTRAISGRIGSLRVSGATTAEQAHLMVARSHPSVIVLDLCIDERSGIESGFELLAWCRKSDRLAKLIVLTGHGSLAHGVRALTLGAASFIEKPVDPEHLAALIRDAAKQVELWKAHERSRGARSQDSGDQLVGESRAIHELREQISFLGSTPQPVLILGETGTGKGLCAQLIHQASARTAGQFVHYQPNYGGGDLAQSELFGHIKGAFTGANDNRRGLAVEADGGTLFLDEVDEIPPEVQVRLLDLVQEQRIRPVGSDSWRKVNCRFIAATNRPLDQALAEHKIRRDLYHRLAINLVHIPPLRERIEDLSSLCDAFLRSMRERELVQVYEIEARAIEALKREAWPGNVRQLQGVIESSAYRANYHRRSFISFEDLSGLSAGNSPVSDESFHAQVERFKLRLVSDAVREHKGSQVQAARALGLDRGTLRRILKG